MNKFLISAFVLILIITACNNKYKYVEITKEKDLIGDYYNEKEKEPEDIFAKNDSLAYLKAFERFCISVEVYKKMAAGGMAFASIPMEFSLYNEDGEKILPYIQPETLNEIENRIMSLGSTINDSLEIKNSPSLNVKVDSFTINKLSPYFDFKKDEFDPRGLTWIKPKSAPKYTNRNGIYCYFMKDINGVSNFRFRIQYHSEDWLFIHKYQFSIDGKAYEFIPDNVERDSGNGGKIWEWCDENVMSNNEIDIIKALSQSKNAKIKFIGRQYYDIRSISKKEIQSIKRTLDLYMAMGGNL